MGFDRKLSTAEVSAAVERAFARQEGREPKLPTRTDTPVIGELASLDTLEYELQRDTAAAGLGIRVSALDKLIKGRRAAEEDENAALPHWNVEPSAEPVDGAALLNNLRQVFRRYIVLPKGADIALPLWVLHAWTMDAGDISPLMVLVSPTKRCGKTSALIVLYFLTPRSELSSNITASALFRYIEDVRPTLLIDEADSFAKDNEELRGILELRPYQSRRPRDPQPQAQAAPVFDLGAEGGRHDRRSGRHPRGPRRRGAASAKTSRSDGRAPGSPGQRGIRCPAQSGGSVGGR